MEPQDSTYRQFKGLASVAVYGFLVIISLYHIAVILGIFGPGVWELVPAQILATSLGLLLVAFFFYFPATSKAPKDRVPWYDLTLVGMILAPTIYFVTFYIEFYYRPGVLTALEVVLAVMATVACLEATRRSTGWVLVILALVFVIYPLFGDYMPGFLFTRRFSVTDILAVIWHGTSGIYGVVTEIIPKYIFSFVFFGAVLTICGGAQFFSDLAAAVFGRFRGGAAKTAIVLSGLVGGTEGSVVVNVIMVAPISLPLMREAGHKAEYSAAVLAAGACGAVLMPPVMGVTAFLMADFLGIPYLRVVQYGILPAILYYVALFCQIHFDALKLGTPPLPSARLRPIKTTLSSGLHLYLAVALLIGLLVLYYPPANAALYASGALILFSWIRKETRIGIKRLGSALTNAAVSAAQLAAMIAGVGLIVGSIDLTGLGFKLSSGVVELAGGSFLLLLIYTFITNLILGMGLGGFPAYILLAVLVAPGLVAVGMPPIAAHMFIFYTSLVGNLTPPVCVGTYVAAVLANAKMWPAGLLGFRLSIATFLVAFAFAYSPALLLVGAPSEVALAAAGALVGVIALASGVSGYAWRRLDWFDRVLLICGAVGLVAVGWVTDLIGVGLIMIVVAKNVIAAWGAR